MKKIFPKVYGMMDADDFFDKNCGLRTFYGISCNSKDAMKYAIKEEKKKPNLNISASPVTDIYIMVG